MKGTILNLTIFDLKLISVNCMLFSTSLAVGVPAIRGVLVPQFKMELLKDTKLIHTNGEEESSVTEHLKGHIVGLYFSASWCPPCKQFTQVLANVYKELRKRGSNFQIVFLSADKDESEMMRYFQDFHGNWLAAAFGQPIINELQEKFNVMAVPKLIIVDEAGEVITLRGRKDITDKGVSAFRSWSSKTQLHVLSSMNTGGQTNTNEQSGISKDENG